MIHFRKVKEAKAYIYQFLKLEHLKLHDFQGDDFHTFSTNSSFYQIPNNEYILASLKTFFENYSKLNLDNFEVSLPELKLRHDIFISKKIKGIQLSKEYLSELAETDVQIIIKKIASFIAQLHSQDFKVKKQNNEVLDHVTQAFSSFFKTVKTNDKSEIEKKSSGLMIHLLKNLDDYNYDLFWNYFTNKVFPNDHCLTHYDLHLGNMLYDPHKKEVAVLDFYNMTTSTPYVDFVYLFEQLEEKYFDLLITEYSKKTGKIIKREKILELSHYFSKSIKNN